MYRHLVQNKPIFAGILAKFPICAKQVVREREVNFCRHVYLLQKSYKCLPYVDSQATRVCLHLPTLSVFTSICFLYSPRSVFCIFSPSAFWLCFLSAFCIRLDLLSVFYSICFLALLSSAFCICLHLLTISAYTSCLYLPLFDI